MKDLNSITLTGRLADDVEMRHAKDGTPWASLRLAVNKGKDQEADFVRCVAKGPTAENLQKYTRKGSRLLIQGSLSCRKWKDTKTGDNREVWEVFVFYPFFLDPPQKQQQEETPAGAEEDWPY